MVVSLEQYRAAIGLFTIVLFQAQLVSSDYTNIKIFLLNMYIISGN